FSLSLSGVCECFNVDVKRPRVFTGPAEAQFGYQVLQHQAGQEKWLLVGAPWEGPANNRKGDVYKCIVGQERNSNCTRVNLGETALQNVSQQLRNSHLGMTLSPTHPDGFLACAPLWSQECGTSVFSTGICASVDDHLHPREIIAPTAQRCATFMDIVIVLDGSNSIYPWFEVQNFLSNILSKFHISPEQMQVGVLQYGEVAIHEWSLNDFSSTAQVVEAARNISRQEGRETRTAYAVHMGCTEAFSAERGAREGAAKVMIVVTDGESHDGEELPQALQECEKRNITRYAIAVLGHYIRRQQDPEAFLSEIKYIASDPDEKFFFNVTDEAALNDIVDALGDRIFSLEGTLGYNESSFEMEMSQIGFSTHSMEDGILFGTVGAYDWDGGVLREGPRGRVVPPRGYAVCVSVCVCVSGYTVWYTVSSVTVRSGKRLCVAGAPRFRHKGKVVLFDLKDNGEVTFSQALHGEQIGSYFGSEVCPVDLDADGVTDVLLVAAPMFLGSGNRETGRVYIYTLSRVLFTPNGTLQAHKRPQDARFGFAMATVPDLNRDGLADLLVGAPLEDGHRGALYIYHGQRNTINPQYKQRIAGSVLASGLQYFGRSVSGQLDLDGDGLLDVAVGAQGSAVLLSSRSIVRIGLSVDVQPHSISVVQRSCQRGGREAACLTASVCFNTSTPGPPGPPGPNFELHLSAMLDERGFTVRALFDESGQRHLHTALRLQPGHTTCHPLPFHVFDTADYLRPLSLSLRFRINESESGPVLDEGWPTSAKTLIPFYKGCGDDDICITDLVLQGRLGITGTRQDPYIIRSPRRRLSVDLQLHNRLENAFNTSLRLLYSRNLHFSSLSSKDSPQVKLECTALTTNSQSCNVSYPVFRSQAKVTFNLEFEFSCSLLLNRVQMKIMVSSDSVEREDTMQDNTVQLGSAVLYEPDLFISSDSALRHYVVPPSRSASEAGGPEFSTTVKVQNLGCVSVSGLDIHVQLPAAVAGDTPFLTVTEVTAHNVTGVNCSVLSDLRALRDRQTETRPVHPEELHLTPQLNCSTAWCVQVVCRLQQLHRGQEALLSISRRLDNDFFRKVSERGKEGREGRERERVRERKESRRGGTESGKERGRGGRRAGGERGR
ncbi:ITA10 protein, partial [Amia calva]|nr:ITA10 protein [Amia calva]